MLSPRPSSPVVLRGCVDGVNKESIENAAGYARGEKGVNRVCQESFQPTGVVTAVPPIGGRNNRNSFSVLGAVADPMVPKVEQR